MPRTVVAGSHLIFLFRFITLTLSLTWSTCFRYGISCTVSFSINSRTLATLAFILWISCKNVHMHANSDHLTTTPSIMAHTLVYSSSLQAPMQRLQAALFPTHPSRQPCMPSSRVWVAPTHAPLSESASGNETTLTGNEAGHTHLGWHMMAL